VRISAFSARDFLVSLEFCGGKDDDVAGETDATQRSIHGHHHGPPAPLHIGDDQEIDVTTLIGLISRMRTEKNNLLWME
jgi:hypothetical protein